MASNGGGQYGRGSSARDFHNCASGSILCLSGRSVSRKANQRQRQHYDAPEVSKIRMRAN